MSSSGDAENVVADDSLHQIPSITPPTHPPTGVTCESEEEESNLRTHHLVLLFKFVLYESTKRGECCSGSRGTSTEGGEARWAAIALAGLADRQQHTLLLLQQHTLLALLTKQQLPQCTTS